MRSFVAIAVVASASLLHNNTYAQRWTSGTHAAGEDIYKHYTGTIGGQKVVLDLRYGYQGASNYGGSTYYFPAKDGRTAFHILHPGSSNHDVTLSAREYTEDTSLTDLPPNPEPSSGWNFRIEGDKLVGMWHSATDRERANVELVEDYSNSYPMEIAFFCNDVNTKPYPRPMTCAIPSARMNPDDAAFVTAEEIRFLSADKIKATTWDEYERLNAGNFEELSFFHACVQR